MVEDLDLLDRQILSILQKNARRGYANIARELNVNEATVRFRVKKLVEKQVIIQLLIR